MSEPPSDEFSETSDEVSEPLDESERSNDEGDLDENDDFVIVEASEEDNTQRGPILVPTSAVENFIREVSVGSQLSHCTVRELIHSFGSSMNYRDLPKDARTILRRGATELRHEDSDVA